MRPKRKINKWWSGVTFEDVQFQHVEPCTGPWTRWLMAMTTRWVASGERENDDAIYVCVYGASEQFLCSLFLRLLLLLLLFYPRCTVAVVSTEKPAMSHIFPLGWYVAVYIFVFLFSKFHLIFCYLLRSVLVTSCQCSCWFLLFSLSHTIYTVCAPSIFYGLVCVCVFTSVSTGFKNLCNFPRLYTTMCILYVWMCVYFIL